MVLDASGTGNPKTRRPRRPSRIACRAGLQSSSPPAALRDLSSDLRRMHLLLIAALNAEPGATRACHKYAHI